MDQLAKMESRNTSELFREAFRNYFVKRSRARMEEIGKLTLAHNPKDYTQEDTNRLVSEARTEMKAARQKK